MDCARRYRYPSRATIAAPETAAHLDVLGGARGVDEHTGTLNDQVDVHVSPGQLGGVTGGHNGDALAVHGDGLVIHHLHVSVEHTEGGVVLEHVAGLLHTSAVVDGDNLQQAVLAAVQAAVEDAADTAEAVDRHAQLLLGGHGLLVADGALRTRASKFRQ